MTLWGGIIAAALLAEYGAGALADLLQLRALRKPLPPEFRGSYDDETFRRSCAYAAARTRFGMFSSAANLAALFLFWFARGFDALDALVRAWHAGPVVTGIAWIGILVAARALFGLPFRLYATFVIEERF